MSDTYADAKLEQEIEDFGGFGVHALEQYTSTKHLEPLEGLQILERLASATHSTSQAADYRYLHRLIMQLDSSPLPF